MKALYVAVILAPTDLRYLVSFSRYGRLKKKCWYKQICNGTYWLLMRGHFGPVFIRPSQWSITAVSRYSGYYISQPRSQMKYSSAMYCLLYHSVIGLKCGHQTCRLCTISQAGNLSSVQCTCIGPCVSKISTLGHNGVESSRKN